MENNGNIEYSNTILKLCTELEKNNYINPEDFNRFNVKKGLRNSDGTGVMAGLTRICSVEGYYVDDGERVPKDGRLIYRGYDVVDLVENCEKENRFGFLEIIWLLIFGSMPTVEQYSIFEEMLAQSRELPENFIEDMMMKVPSPDIMNKMGRLVLSLYPYDDNADDTSTANVLRQSIELIARLPIIMSYAYQVKRRHYYKKSMHIHQINHDDSTAESILRTIRTDCSFTDEEAKLLDLCLILHAEHGGGNNSTFSTRVLTSSGTDTYSAIAAGIGSLKGPKHGGANIKVKRMIDDMMYNIENVNSEGQVADYIKKILEGKANDGSKLVYGMGHAVYTISDPRAVILKERARPFCKGTEYEERFNLIENIEKLSPIVFKEMYGTKKQMCANVDLYSGLVYDMLGIPEDLFTPLFAVSRIPGWCAHRIEELTTANRIIRPAYKSVSLPHKYVPMEQRKESKEKEIYIPTEERI